VLEGGRIAEYGSRAALAADPASRFAGLLRTAAGDVDLDQLLNENQEES